MGKVANPSTKVFPIGSTLKWIFNEPKMLSKNVHALWIMLGTTTRGDAHFCYTFDLELFKLYKYFNGSKNVGNW